jgi:hypothetical protein
MRVEVRRSARRKRSVSAYVDGDTVVVQIPAWFSKKQEAEWVEKMVARALQKTATAGRRVRSDEELMRRATELSAAYLDGRARPSSVRWVTAMRTRWASCTPGDRSIRVSERLKSMPIWVQDYVLVHELAHLIEAGHTPRFWELVAAYPKTERARGYLDGVSDTANLNLSED